MLRTREGFLWSQDGEKHGLQSAAVVDSTNSIKNEYDVVIIGAGWAGLIAARDLSQRTDLSVLIVEARDRIGGRTWTARELGQEFEMGGNWIIWSQPHLWTELQRYGMDKDIVSSSGTYAPEKTFFTPEKGSAKEMHDIDSSNVGDFDAIAEAFFGIDGHTSRSLMPFPHDPFREPAVWKKYDSISVKDRIEQMRATEKFSDADLDIFEGITNGSGLTQASKRGFTEFLFWWALGGHSMAGITEANGMWKLGNGGMTEFAKRTLADYSGDMVMNSEVSKIQQFDDDKAVRIGMKDGRTIDSGHVISTIPLNCLSCIEFDPPFSPLRQEAVDQGHVNLGSKIHFEQSGDVKPWVAFCSPKSDAAFSSAISDHNSDSKSYGVAFGYAESDLDLEKPGEVLPHLQSLFPTDQRSNITAYVTHDWKNDPFSKGAWVAFAPEYMAKYQQELQKDHGRVTFASGDWADGWRGFVDGAMASGAQAARRVFEKHRTTCPKTNGVQCVVDAEVIPTCHSTKAEACNSTVDPPFTQM